MRILLCIGLISILTACGEPLTRAEQLVPYLEKFEQLAQENGVNVYTAELILEVADITQPTSGPYVILGQCRTHGGLKKAGPGDYRKIIIDPTYWNGYLSDARREAVMFHELGHCILGRDHIDTRGSNGYPTSLMSSVLLSEYAYTTWHEDYITELFQGY